MPYAEVAAAAAVIAWIELRVARELRTAVRQLERDYADNGGRRRVPRAAPMREDRARGTSVRSHRER